MSLRDWTSICALLGAVALAVGCTGQVKVDEPLGDDAERYIGDVAYRRGILERDLTDRDNEYAELRLELYGVEGSGWERLAERDPRSRLLRASELEALEDGGPF